MNNEKKIEIIAKIYKCHRKYSAASRICLIAILSLILLFIAICYFLAKEEYGFDDEIFGILFAISIPIIFLFFILSSLYKYNSTLSNFWYSRIIALDLYEDETQICLNDLVASFASEGIKPSIPSPQVIDWSSFLSKINQNASGTNK